MAHTAEGVPAQVVNKDKDDVWADGGFGGVNELRRESENQGWADAGECRIKVSGHFPGRGLSGEKSIHPFFFCFPAGWPPHRGFSSCESQSRKAALSFFATSGFCVARSFFSPMSAARSKSCSGSLGILTSFQLPLRTADCAPKSQNRNSWGAPLFSSDKYGSKFTPSSRRSVGSFAPATASAVGWKSNAMTGSA